MAAACLRGCRFCCAAFVCVAVASIAFHQRIIITQQKGPELGWAIGCVLLVSFLLGMCTTDEYTRTNTWTSLLFSLPSAALLCALVFRNNPQPTQTRVMGYVASALVSFTIIYSSLVSQWWTKVPRALWLSAMVVLANHLVVAHFELRWHLFLAWCLCNYVLILLVVLFRFHSLCAFLASSDTFLLLGIGMLFYGNPALPENISARAIAWILISAAVVLAYDATVSSMVTFFVSQEVLYCCSIASLRCALTVLQLYFIDSVIPGLILLLLYYLTGWASMWRLSSMLREVNGESLPRNHLIMRQNRYFPLRLTLLATHFIVTNETHSFEYKRSLPSGEYVHTWHYPLLQPFLRLQEEMLGKEFVMKSAIMVPIIWRKGPEKLQRQGLSIGATCRSLFADFISTNLNVEMADFFKMDQFLLFVPLTMAVFSLLGGVANLFNTRLS